MMYKILLVLVIPFLAYDNSYSQKNKKSYDPDIFANIMVGIERKENNSDLLTMKVNTILPVLKFSYGGKFVFNNNHLYSISYSNISVTKDDVSNFLSYQKDEVALNYGIETIKNKLKIRNQVGVQINYYSIISLSKNNNQMVDSFQFKGNKFSSSKNYCVNYGLELSRNTGKKINFIGGLNTSYLIKKDNILTKKDKERISFQAYFGIRLNIIKMLK